jgi:hypothetical protein
LKGKHQGLRKRGINLVLALRIDTHAKQESRDEPGEEYVLGVGAEEEESLDDGYNDDDYDSEAEKVPKQIPIKIEVVDFDGCYELPEEGWEVLIMERFTAVGIIVRDDEK